MFFQIVENTFVQTRLFCWGNVFIRSKNLVFVIFGDWSVEQIYNTTTMFADSSNQICFSQFTVSYHFSPFCNISQLTNSFTFLIVHSYIYIYKYFIFKPKYLISWALDTRTCPQSDWRLHRGSHCRQRHQVLMSVK